MLQCYDFYDIYAVFVNIRSAPKYPLNESILVNIIKVLESQEDNHGLNQIRHAIQPLLATDNEGMYSFAKVENEYRYFPYPNVKDKNIYLFLAKVCELLLQAVRDFPDEQIIDLADCFHNLPTQIVENKNMIPVRFWKNEVKNYRKKWDRHFLLDEEKTYKKASR